MAIKKNKLAMSTLLIIILLVAILGVSIYIAIVSKGNGRGNGGGNGSGNGGGNSGGNGGQVCDSTCQKNIAKQVTAALTTVIGENTKQVSKLVISGLTDDTDGAMWPKMNTLLTNLQTNLTTVIEKNACGEQCQKGIACNVLNNDDFSTMVSGASPGTANLGTILAKTASNTSSILHPDGTAMSWFYKGGDIINPCSKAFPFPPSPSS